MEKLLSVYLWAWKNYKSGETSIKSVRRLYQDADVFINVDYEGDHENYQRIAKELNAVYSKNNFQVGYCGDHGEVKVGRACWSRESSFEWVRGLYEACLKSNSKYMLILEEDDFVLRPISILNTEFSMAVHASMPSSAGNWRPNHLPNEFMMYSANLGGEATAPGYGAGGGCTFNREHFIKSWERAKEPLWRDYDSLKAINKIIGWQDFLVQFIMMIGGYEIRQYNHAAQPWEVPNWQTTKAACGDDFEMVCGFSDKYIKDPVVVKNFMDNINDSYERRINIGNSKL